MRLSRGTPDHYRDVEMLSPFRNYRWVLLALWLSQSAINFDLWADKKIGERTFLTFRRIESELSETIEKATAKTKRE
jgi:hypothetical protein